jgi:hypothetical protein
MLGTETWEGATEEQRARLDARLRRELLPNGEACLTWTVGSGRTRWTGTGWFAGPCRVGWCRECDVCNALRRLRCRNALPAPARALLLPLLAVRLKRVGLRAVRPAVAALREHLPGLEEGRPEGRPVCDLLWLLPVRYSRPPWQAL